MNFKKFISGVSAFAIAASAFAGMAVTASAAVTVFENDCSTTDSWTPGGQASVAVYPTNPAEGDNTYVGTSGTGSGNRTATYAFPAEVTSITSGSMSVSFDFQFSDNNGTANRAVAKIALNGNSGEAWSLTSTTWPSTRNDTYYTSTDTENTFTVGKSTWFTLTASIDYNNDVMDVTVKNKSTGATLCSSTGVPFTSANLASLIVQSPRYDSGSRVTYIDNILVTTPDPGAATAVEVNYTLGGTAIVTERTDISAQNLISGSDYSFNAPAYVEKDGAVYSTGLSGNKVSTKKTVSLSEGTTTVNIPVTLAAAVGAYFEAEDNGGSTDVTSDYYSRGKGKRNLGSKQVQITVPADGIYTVTIGLSGNRSDANDCTINAYNGNYSAEATPLFSYSTNRSNAYYGGEMSQANITLLGGSKLTFNATDGNNGLDYILLNKTGDLPTPAEASEVVEDETVTTYEGDSVATFRFTVTPNDESVTSITVTADGATGAASQTISTPTLSGDGSINCAIIATYKTAAPEASAFSVSIN